MMEELRVLNKGAEGCIRVALSGEIDIYNAPAIQEELLSLASNSNEVQISLADLNFIDSTGLGMLIRLARELKGKKGSVVVINPQPQVYKLLETTGLDSVLTVRRED